MQLDILNGNFAILEDNLAFLIGNRIKTATKKYITCDDAVKGQFEVINNVRSLF